MKSSAPSACRIALADLVEPGDAFYVPPGHLQRAEAGAEYLQFSPAKQLAEVEQQVMKNMQAMGGPQ